MALVRVYQHDFYDPLIKRERRCVDYATSDSIAERGGRILAESERMVDEELLEEDGTIRAAHMPPREVAERLPRTPPGETRMGPG